MHDAYPITPPTRRDRREARGEFLPSPDELRAGLAAIQAGWSETDRLARRGAALGLTVAEFRAALAWQPPEFPAPPG